nr:hypothetical protein [Rhodoblastus acidophilus]
MREPRLAAMLGGLENMYQWHHRLGMAAYAALLAHPLLLAAASLPKAPREAWELLSPMSEGWPVWMGWLALIALMVGLGATFAKRPPIESAAPCTPCSEWPFCSGWPTSSCWASTNRLRRSFSPAWRCWRGASFARTGALALFPMSSNRWSASPPTPSKSRSRRLATRFRRSLGSSLASPSNRRGSSKVVASFTHTASVRLTAFRASALQ